MNEQYVFGLDIGTRSIVGSVGYLERNRFKVVAQHVKEHETRAMLDGQIHDIGQVSASIERVKKELEAQIGQPLTDVCIAAAGRVLKTKTVHVDYDLPEDAFITGEQVYALDLLGVEAAYEEIRKEETGIKFYCVGYTVVKYYLNDYVISNLEGHKGRRISADVLATFLPEEVVDGLYSAVNSAELQVANLTLEPIAAINIAIPENFRLLNIALIDVGAGTSDISITKDGSIIAYGMIPRAGDEITECLVSRYLVDFNTAEKMKRDAAGKKKTVTFTDVMGIKQKVPAEDIRSAYADTVASITTQVADKITELNGGKSVSAVFVVGGGGKAQGFTEGIAKCLNLPSERVALRGEEVLGSVDFLQEGIKKDPLLVTPIGICLNYYNQKNNFIFVNINGQRIKLYDNDKLTVVDAAMQIEFPNEDLFPKRGKELNYFVNGATRMTRGSMGEPAVITINGEAANINSHISKNDRIVIEPSSVGAPASMKIEQIAEYKSEIRVNMNDQMIICPRFAQVNDSLEAGSYEIKENDQIQILDYYTVAQLMTFMDIDTSNLDVYVNHQLADADEKIYENFSIRTVERMASEDKEIEEPDSTDTSDTSYTQEERSEEGKPNTITVTLNGSPLTLSGKENYLFVDLLDVYPFDASHATSKVLVQTCNGEACDFTQSIKTGDILELFWR